MILAFLMAISVFSSSAQDLKARVIYGEDHRLDLYQVKDQRLLALADSTVGLVKLARLEEHETFWKFIGPAYGEHKDLCSTEKFYDQFVGPNCTGFLVAANKIATAGHCIESFSDCVGRKFVFGYGMYEEGVHPLEVPKSEVYSCAKIIKTSDGAVDFAVIELDRPVTNHPPLSLNLTGAIAKGTPLFVIGHPSGLPTKIAGGAHVRSSDDVSFTSNLDTYGGNSGSPVFNANTLEVEGILVRGEWDFVDSADGTCQVSNICSDYGCTGEDSTKASVMKDFVNSTRVSY